MEHAIDLFLSKDNLLHVWGVLNGWRSNHGTSPISYEAVESSAVEWTLDMIPPETGNSVLASVVAEHYNREFVRSMTQGKFNPFTRSVNGVNFADIMPEDYGKLDYWEPNHIFAVERSTKKGSHNPHVIGAHKRHYDTASEGLRQHEKGPTRNSGWDMSIFE